MRNIALVVSYDGTAYHGWQRQPDRITIQEVLEDRIRKIVNHNIKIYAGGRTDSGVHAYGQVINFFTESAILPTSLKRGLNSLLPADIRVVEASDIHDKFHARYSAKSKIYVYTILNQPHNSPFHARYVWHIPWEVDVAPMKTAAGIIMGSHDFSSFKKKEVVYKSHIRDVFQSAVKRQGNFIYIIVEATGFLRYMVRNIVGTLILVGSGRLSPHFFREILECKDRDKAGPTAPAKGLFLRKIKY